MNEQFKPIKEEPKMNQGFIETEPKITNIPNQNIYSNQPTNEDIIKNLPEWSIEPPVEINRGIS